MKHSYRKMISVLLALFLMMSCSVSAFAGLFYAVAPGYTNKQKTGGTIEEKYSKMGPYKVKSKQYNAEKEDGKQRHYKVWYPAEDGKYPLVLMVNGTGIPYQKYGAVFEHLASWGFVVIGNDFSVSWDGKSTNDMLDFALSTKEIRDRVDEEKIAVGGHSQGGEGAFNAITEFPENQGKYKSAFILSPTSNPLAVALEWSHKTGTEDVYGYDLGKVQIPVLLAAGDGKFDSETISPLEEMQKDLTEIPSDVPVVMARLKDTDHGDVLQKADGYVTAWLLYTLNGDTEAEKAFYGKNPEMKQNTLWRDFTSRR